MQGKRVLAARLLRHSGVGPVLLGRRRWRGVLVLAYHRILPSEVPGRFPGVWSATPEGFAEQMDLVAGGCDVVPIDQVPMLHDAPGRHVALTFDDGYRDNHTYALPVLRERGLPATIFVVSGILDGTATPWWDELAWLHGGLRPGAEAEFGTVDDVVLRYWEAGPADTGPLLEAVAAQSVRARLAPEDVRDEWMTWDHVREMRAGGVEIGAHTVTHPLLGRLDAERQTEEITLSADRIGEETGHRPTSLAYPVGSRDAFDERSKAAARAAGMRAAYSLYGGPTTASTHRWDPFDIRRVGVDIRHAHDDFAALLTLPRVFGQRAAPEQAAAANAPAPETRAGPLETPSRAPTTSPQPELPVVAPRGRRTRRSSDGRIWVVTLVDRLTHGGAERLAYQLTRDLDPDRFARVMCVTTAGDARHAAPGTESVEWRERLRDSGVRLVELDRARRSDPRGWGPALRELRRADVLHAHMFVPNVQAAVLGPLTGVPVTISHEHTWAHTGGPHQALVDRTIVARRCDAMIACSGAVRDRMLEDGVPAERVVVLPNGIEGLEPTPGRDLRAELGISPNTLVVGSVGAMREIKRFDVLVDAADVLRRTHPDVQVVIAGDGDERHAIEERISRLDLGGTVRLLGARSDVPDVVAIFDVAITSSDSEASPLSVMEYMDAGRAIVSTSVGGVPELLDDGVHGRLVERRNPEAMAAAIAGLLDDPEQRARLGAAARERRKAEFGLDVMVDRVESLYERLYARAGAGRRSILRR